MPQYKVNRFLGLVTRPKRSQRAPGSLTDMKNFALNSKAGALVQRTGYTSDISGTITAVGGETITNGNLLYFEKLATENPAAQYVDWLVGSDGSSQRMFQKGFFDPKSAAWNTATVNWGELNSGETSGSTSQGVTTVVTSITGYGNDYFKYWTMRFTATGDYYYVTAYTSATGTFTILEQTKSVYSTATAITLYRYFHDNPGFTPAYNTNVSLPAVALQVGNSIIASGGRNTTTGNKAIVSQYVNQTLMVGASKTLVYNGTYVSELEVKSTNGYATGNIAESTATDKGLDQSVAWSMGFLFETVDGQKSKFIRGATHYRVPSAASKGIQTAVEINSLINKRFRYLTVFMARGESTGQTSFEWNAYYRTQQIDLATAGHGFTYQETVASTTIGLWLKTIALDITHWDSRGANLVDYLNLTEYANASVSFSRATTLANRLFIADYYDYGAGLSYPDQIRYTAFSDGIPQYSVLPDIDDFTQSTIEQGDPTSIRAIATYNNRLFVAKDRSCYYIDLTGDPSTWTLVPISREIGCDNGWTVVVTPLGVFWAKSNEDVYSWDGGYPKSVAGHVLDTLKTNMSIAPTTLFSWYDNRDRSYNIRTEQAASDLSVFYKFYLDIPVSVEGLGVFPACVKMDLVDNVWWVKTRADGKLYFNTGSGNSTVLTFSDTVFTDNGTAITTFFDTGDFVLDERGITQLDRWWIANDQESGITTAGNLDVQFLVNGTSVGSYEGLTKTKTYLSAFLPLTALGTRVRFKWNTDASPATYTTASATQTRLTIEEIGFDFDILPRVGDLAQQI